MKSFLFIVLALILAACTPRPPEPPPFSPPAEPPVGPPPGLPPRGDRPPPPRAVPVPEKPNRPFDETLLTGKEFLLETLPVTAPPLDFGLGALDSGPVAASAKVFLEAVVAAGDQPIDAGKLDARWATYLQGWARRMTKDGLSGTVRTGTPLPEKDGGSMVPVRVIGEKKEWLGWVFLVKTDSGWVTADAQLEARDRDTAPFDPESPIQPH